MKRLITMYDGEHEQFRPVTLPSIRRFAGWHGYDLQVLDRMPHQADRAQHSCWSKLPALGQALAGGCEVALWVDGDVVIVDHTVDPAAALGPGKFLAILQDARYGICGAVFALRRCATSIRFLVDAWEMRREDFPDWDQGAMQRLVDRDEYASGVALLGYDWFGPEGSGPDARIIHGCRQTAGTVPERVASLRARAAARIAAGAGA